jgi:hypothetical protein
LSSQTNPLTPPTGRFYKAAGPALLAHLGRLRVLLGDAEPPEGQSQVLMGTVPDPIDAGRPMARGHPEVQRNVLPLNAVTSPLTVGAALTLDGAAGALGFPSQVGGGGAQGALHHLMQAALVQAKLGELDRSAVTGPGTVGARMTEVGAAGRPYLAMGGGGGERALRYLMQVAMVQAKRRGALQDLTTAPARRLQRVPSSGTITSSQPFSNDASTAGRATYQNPTAPFSHLLDPEHPPAEERSGPLNALRSPTIGRTPAIHFDQEVDWMASSGFATVPLGTPAMGQEFPQATAPDDDFMFEERLRQALAHVFEGAGPALPLHLDGGRPTVRGHPVDHWDVTPPSSVTAGGRALGHLMGAAMVQAKRRGALQALVTTPARRLQNITAPFSHLRDPEQPPASDPSGSFNAPFSPTIHFEDEFSEEMAPDDDFVFEERLRQALVRILRNDGLRHGLSLGERPS